MLKCVKFGGKKKTWEIDSIISDQIATCYQQAVLTNFVYFQTIF